MKLFIPEDLEKYAHDHTSVPSTLLDRIEQETIAGVPNSQMLTGRVEGTFLRMLVRISGARRALEIGTFTGYSALMIAEGLPEDGELITCEISEEHARIAADYFKQSPHGWKIRLAEGPALRTIRQLPAESIDFVFVDADKSRYPLYYEEAIRLLRPGGLMLADNVFWSGEILHPDDEDSRAIAEFNDGVRSDDRVEKVMLSVRDGVYLIRKREGGNGFGSAVGS